MAKYTSAEAAKLLRKLNQERNNLLAQESKTATFVAAMEEDESKVRPDYDYRDMQRQILEVEEKIRTVKHAINCFNTTHTVPGFELTIDEMLVYIPQLKSRAEKLQAMQERLPRERASSAYGASNFIEYTIANYDPADAKKDFQIVSDELARAQLALDKVNMTETMEIAI